VKVRAVVHDLGGKNRGLWKDLEISATCSHFMDPVGSGHSIYFFADAPHLLKQLKSNCMDDGLILGSGETLHKRDFEQMIEKDNAEIKSNYKLTKDLLNVTNRDRQNVSQAAKVFSNSSAHLADIVFPENRGKGAFIRLVNDWFDVFNSRTNKCSSLKAGFGSHFEEQVCTYFLVVVIKVCNLHC